MKQTKKEQFLFNASRYAHRKRGSGDPALLKQIDYFTAVVYEDMADELKNLVNLLFKSSCMRAMLSNTGELDTELYGLTMYALGFMVGAGIVTPDKP